MSFENWFLLARKKSIFHSFCSYSSSSSFSFSAPSYLFLSLAQFTITTNFANRTDEHKTSWVKNLLTNKWRLNSSVKVRAPNRGPGKIRRLDLNKMKCDFSNFCTFNCNFLSHELLTFFFGKALLQIFLNLSLASYEMKQYYATKVCLKHIGFEPLELALTICYHIVLLCNPPPFTNFD